MRGHGDPGSTKEGTSSIGLYTRSRSASHRPTANVHILHRWKRTSRIARAAGQNSDIGAMERAISRLEASVVIADPSLEGLVDADLPFVDLTSSE